MSLDKSIESGKEKRKHYRGAKAVDHTCRNHGTCNFCKRGRLHKSTKKEHSTTEILEEISETEKEYD